MGQKSAGIPSVRSVHIEGTGGDRRSTTSLVTYETRWSSHTKLADRMGSTTVAGQCLMKLARVSSKVVREVGTTRGLRPGCLIPVEYDFNVPYRVAGAWRICSVGRWVDR